MSEIDHETPYSNLSPDEILTAIEAAGYRCDGHLLALNSYENRVYQIGLDDGSKIIAKFYRPDRLSDAAIAEEHTFMAELADAELPCVAPLRAESGETLLHHGGYRFALFPRQGGHAPNLESEDNLRVLGRTLARMHRVGRSGKFEHRPKFSVERLGIQSRDYVLAHDFVPEELIDAYSSVTTHLLNADQPMSHCRCRAAFTAIAIPATCCGATTRHTSSTSTIPSWDRAVQDLWMLLSGERDEQTRSLAKLLEGYEMFLAFDLRELALIEALRTLRIMHHAAWIARRWNDPAFQLGFPAFGGMRYWSEHVLHLREQQSPRSTNRRWRRSDRQRPLSQSARRLVRLRARPGLRIAQRSARAMPVLSLLRRVFEIAQRLRAFLGTGQRSPASRAAMKWVGNSR